MQDHTKLLVWQRARLHTIRMHEELQRMNCSSIPGFRGQVMRAVVAIPANIAEGAGQSSPAQFARYLDIAIGSATELESHLSIAEALGFGLPTTLHASIAETIEIRRMLYGFRRCVLPQKPHK